MAGINPQGHKGMCSVNCSKSILASAHVFKMKDTFQMVKWHLNHKGLCGFFLSLLKSFQIQPDSPKPSIKQFSKFRKGFKEKDILGLELIIYKYGHYLVLVSLNQSISFKKNTQGFTGPSMVL